MRSLLPLIKKELARFFTDKKLLASLLLPGLLIFVMYTIMGNVMYDMYSLDEEAVYEVYVENKSEDLEAILTYAEIKVNYHYTKDYDGDDYDGYITEIKQGITDGNIDLLILFPENFDNLLKPVSQITSTSPEVQIFYNQSENRSHMLFLTVQTLLNELESLQNNLFDINKPDSDIVFNLTIKKNQDNPVAMMIPMLLLTFLVTGVVSVATESIAGEKERGTMATLLITPVSRIKIATAKIFAVSIPSIVSAVVSFLGLYLSLPSLMKMTSEAGMPALSLGAGEIFALLFVVIVTVLLFTVLVSIVSTLSKTVKEAQQFTAPVILIASMSGVLTIFFSNPETFVFFIPIVNSALSITSIFDATFSITNLLITIGTNLFVIIAGIFIIGKMFSSEKIIFTK